MRVLVVGAGAREHAIVWKLAMSSGVTDIYCAPGNGGTGLLAQNVDMPVNTEAACDQLAGWAFNTGIDLVIVGPEVPLSFGMVDTLMLLGVPAFGPTQQAARIETSKSWARDFMQRHNIPSPGYSVAEGLDAILATLHSPDTKYPLVLKADGLAAGKGAVVVQDALEGAEAIAQMQGTGVLPAEDASKKVVFEEFLEGFEVSALAFSDGETVSMMPPACDYKRLLDGDRGPMTGGMGAYSPTSLVTPEVWVQIEAEVLQRAVSGMRSEGIPYKGVLYAGIMLTREGPKVLEFNCRFGDPETQVLLPRLQTPLEEIAMAVARGSLLQAGEIRWSDEAAVGVVVASEGYPIGKTGSVVISGLENASEGALVFHAGTEASGILPLRPQGQGSTGTRKRPVFSALFSESAAPITTGFDFDIRAVGGRILTVVGHAATLEEARKAAYGGVERIKIEGAQYRRDIAARELPNAQAAVGETPDSSSADSST